MRNVRGLDVLLIVPVQLENKLPGLGTAVTGIAAAYRQSVAGERAGDRAGTGGLQGERALRQVKYNGGLGLGMVANGIHAVGAEEVGSHLQNQRGGPVGPLRCGDCGESKARR